MRQTRQETAETGAVVPEEGDQERLARTERAHSPEDLVRVLRETRESDSARPETRFRWRDLAGLLLAVLAALVPLLSVVLEDDAAEPPAPAAVPSIAAQPTQPRNAESRGPVVQMPAHPVAYVMPVGSGVATQIHPRGTFAYGADWRPDGRALALATSEGLFEVGVAETGREAGMPNWINDHSLLTPDFLLSPRYSPSGERLAAFDLNSKEVRVVDRLTGLFRRLKPGLEAEAFLDWSRDGRLAVSVGERIAVVSPNGRIRRTVGRRGALNLLPAWSPDGSRLAFTRQAPIVGAKLSIWIFDFRTNRLRALTDGKPHAAYPAWSPDGERLVYAKYIDGSWDLFMLDFALREERRLTSGVGDEIDPAWSPDGRWLSFVTEVP